MAEAVCGFQQVLEKPAAKPGAENRSLTTILSDFCLLIRRNKCPLGDNRLLTFQFKKLLLVSMSPIINLSAQQLRRAATIKEKIQSLENELGRILGSAAKSVAAVAPKKRRKMSAAGRAKISAAAKARWAKVKATKKK